MDWSDGTYEHTAATLTDAADAVVEALALSPGARVLDLGQPVPPGDGPQGGLSVARSGERALRELVRCVRPQRSHRDGRGHIPTLQPGA
jgi:hypothetical protein